MKPIVFFRDVFMYPNTIMMAIISYFALNKKYRDELLSDSRNSDLTFFELFGIANGLITERKVEMEAYVKFVSEAIGWLKPVISISFWVMMYNIIFR